MDSDDLERLRQLSDTELRKPSLTATPIVSVVERFEDVKTSQQTHSMRLSSDYTEDIAHNNVHVIVVIVCIFLLMFHIIWQ